MEDREYNIILYFNNQYLKLNKFIKFLTKVYNNKKIFFHIICKDTGIDLTKIINFACFIHKNITDCINSINDKIVIFQDMITIHKTNVLDNLFNIMLNDDLEIISLNKEIENERISNQFKQIIKMNQKQDIILFKKYIDTDIIFNLEKWNNYKFRKLYSNDLTYLFPRKIPKKIHFYWDGTKCDYLSSLTIKTFIYNNPDWDVYLWMPQLKYSSKNKWEKDEFIPPHTLSYNDLEFLNYDYIQNELGVKIQYIDYFNLGLKNNCSEVIKSDIFRWKILSEIGGVWSDMDILFVDKIEKTDFEFCKSKFNNIELVISQYKRTLKELPDPINFYYIGFLMSSENNSFFNIMYNESIKNINETSYQGVGGDLMKSHFGLYDNIENIINSNHYANLQSDSVYHYWWADLKNLFLNMSQNNIHEYLIKNNNIIGYHWFRGVHLSKIYTHFYNYANKIQNYDKFNGPINSWVKYFENIFDEKKVIENQKKISIVIGYINRLKQLEITLTTIFKSLHTNFEIIIVNDGTEDLNYLLDKFNTRNIIIIENSNKTYINPCLSYNKGIEKASGEIVILQNPECCHIGDLLTTVNCLLKNNDYMAFSSFYLDNYDKNNILYDILLDQPNNSTSFWETKKIKNIMNYTLDYKKGILPDRYNGWISHHFYKPCYLHFCVAIYKDDLLKIKSFTDEYKDGICFDDDDLVRKVILNNFNMYYFPIPPSQPDQYQNLLTDFSVFVIHQHHNRFSYNDDNIMSKWEINKNIFINTNYRYLRQYFELFKNKEQKTYNTIIFNGSIIKYVNGIYECVFNNQENNIKFSFINSIDKFEYFFDGGNMVLRNNIKELFNYCEYEIYIYTDDVNTIICNNTLLNKENNYFKYNGKLIENSVILTNLPLKLNISISCKMTENLVINNTYFSLNN